MKICVASDNHWQMEPLKKILRVCYDADYYFLLGDSEFTADAILPFVSVRGNNDIFDDYPIERIVEIEGFRFYMSHGHYHQIHLGLAGLKRSAIENRCNVVLFGHTHRYLDEQEDGIRFLNPGSCRYNRDGSGPSFMELHIEKGNLQVKRVFLD